MKIGEDEYRNYYDNTQKIIHKDKGSKLKTLRCNDIDSKCNKVFRDVATQPVHIPSFIRYWTFCPYCGSSASLVIDE